jgi:3-deoxy-7-phosphoheptulonate synthase
MVIILKKSHDKAQLDSLISWLKSKNFECHLSSGTSQTILGLIGDTSVLDIDLLKAMDIVEDVKRILEPYKNVNRRFHPDDTVIEVGGSKIGGGNFGVMAGPCSVESAEQIIGIAEKVKAAGANFLRGGAYKPRSSPYSFQGLRDKGIEMLLEAKKATGLPIVTEIMDISQLQYFDDIDVIQVGTRNMQNFELLKELGKCRKPILLKRGMSATLEELLMSAEYISAGGNTEIILCERGIRTFEPATRNTLDISAVPLLKKLSHLPVIVDPSHATGKASLVKSMCLAAAASGADGIMIEVHNDPAHAWSDGQQSLTPDEFKSTMDAVKHIWSFCFDALKEKSN